MYGIWVQRAGRTGVQATLDLIFSVTYYLELHIVISLCY